MPDRREVEESLRKQDIETGFIRQKIQAEFVRLGADPDEVMGLLIPELREGSPGGMVGIGLDAEALLSTLRTLPNDAGAAAVAASIDLEKMSVVRGKKAE